MINLQDLPLAASSGCMTAKENLFIKDNFTKGSLFIYASILHFNIVCVGYKGLAIENHSVAF